MAAPPRTVVVLAGLMMCCFASARATSYRLLSDEGCMPCSNTVVKFNGDVVCGSDNCSSTPPGCREFYMALVGNPEDPWTAYWCYCGSQVIPNTCNLVVHVQNSTGAHTDHCTGYCNYPDCPEGSECEATGASYPKACRCME